MTDDQTPIFISNQILDMDWSTPPLETLEKLPDLKSLSDDELRDLQCALANILCQHGFTWFEATEVDEESIEPITAEEVQDAVDFLKRKLTKEQK